MGEQEAGDAEIKGFGGGKETVCVRVCVRGMSRMLC